MKQTVNETVNEITNETVKAIAQESKRQWMRQ